MNKESKIYVAGHRGLVGSAILKELQYKGYVNIIIKSHQELDLINSEEVASFFKKEQPEYVFLAAAKVGGILANNTYRADFIYENLMIQNNVIHQSYVSGVKKLLFLGSTCIYPKNAPQPLKEDYLLSGALEYTNEPYAIAKIAGIKMCESYNLQYNTNFIAIMPTNLYGPNDNFDLETSHVLPALIRKIHLGNLLSKNDWESITADLNHLPIKGVSGAASKQQIIEVLYSFGIKIKEEQVHVELWGSGKPSREFMWSEDMAAASVYIMEQVNFIDCITPGAAEIRNTHINIGTGSDVTIKELAELIKKQLGFNGSLEFDSSKPDGTLKKLTEVSKLNGLGWEHTIDLKEGISKLYNWYLNN
ncbi:MAG: GDP-fucose synthetase [Kordia sp.]|nr:MAG: GDP-fucose synthetase [Kordia sp.]